MFSHDFIISKVVTVIVESELLSLQCELQRLVDWS
jgi:hypothetical protein